MFWAKAKDRMRAIEAATSDLSDIVATAEASEANDSDAENGVVDESDEDIGKND